MADSVKVAVRVRACSDYVNANNDVGKTVFRLWTAEGLQMRRFVRALNTLHILSSELNGLSPCLVSVEGATTTIVNPAAPKEEDVEKQVRSWDES